jgi:serine/threonine protein phosphatase PrpC
MEIRIRAAASSDVGRQHKTNEDAFGFDLDRGLFVVCDGVGGNAAGEVASRLAVDCMLSRFPYGLQNPNAGGPELQRAVQAANRAIYQAADSEPFYRGMCTTLVAAYYDGARMWIAHVGDSRAYLLRRDQLHRLTDDHSQLAQVLRRGDYSITPDEMARWDSVLTQAIGASDFIMPAVTVVQVHLGDCFMLATDGICKTLTNGEMLSLFLTTSTPEQACQQLVDAANRAGGHDNATCIVVEID